MEQRYDVDENLTDQTAYQVDIHRRRCDVSRIGTLRSSEKMTTFIIEIGDTSLARPDETAPRLPNAAITLTPVALRNEINTYLPVASTEPPWERQRSLEALAAKRSEL